MNDSKIVEISTPTGRPSSNGGGDGGDISSRVAKLEAHLQHLATKKEISDLKVWILSGVLGGAGLAASIAFLFIRAFGV